MTNESESFNHGLVHGANRVGKGRQTFPLVNRKFMVIGLNCNPA